MTSSRRILRLVLLVLALAAVWGAIWFGASSRLKVMLETALVRMEQRGARAACENPATSGFPLRLSLTCDATAYARDLDGVALNAGRLDARWSIAAPLTLSADLTSPMHAELPGLVPLDLAWESARADLGLWLPRPSRVTAELDRVTATTGGPGAAAPVFSLAGLALRADVAGKDVLVSASGADLRLDTAHAGDLVLPPLALALDATLKDAAAGLVARRPSLRGATIDLAEMRIAAADGGALRLSGTLAIDDAGIVDGELTLNIDNPGRFPAYWKAAAPEFAAQAQAILDAAQALQIGGSSAGIPIRIEKGEAFAGFWPLGFIPPLR